jgi:hypothetical protein
MLKYDDFVPVSQDERSIILAHYQKYPQMHSDNSFTNMVCWNPYAHYEYAFSGKSLVLASTIDNSLSFRVPIGPKNKRLMSEVYSLAFREGGENPLLIFGEQDRDWFIQQRPEVPVYPDRDFFDYVYLTRDLAFLKGKKYLTIRKALNKFSRECRYETERIADDNMDGVRIFLEKWCEWKHCDEKPVLSFEKEAVMYAISHFHDLELEGLIVRVNDAVSAMAMFDELNPSTALVHFEKALPECKGIYKCINHEIASLLIDRYAYINRESDLGIKGLREAKLRYHPHMFSRVYYLNKDDMN